MLEEALRRSDDDVDRWRGAAATLQLCGSTEAHEVLTGTGSISWAMLSVSIDFDSGSSWFWSLFKLFIDGCVEEFV